MLVGLSTQVIDLGHRAGYRSPDDQDRTKFAPGPEFVRLLTEKWMLPALPERSLLPNALNSKFLAHFEGHLVSVTMGMLTLDELETHI